MKVIKVGTEEEARDFLRSLEANETKLVSRESLAKIADVAIGVEYRKLIKAIILTNLVFLIVGYILGRII